MAPANPVPSADAVRGSADVPKDAIVAARAVERMYGAGDAAHMALKGVDFDAREGEMVAIMGESGCGKTTLLNCLSGLDRPTKGRIFLAGTELTAIGEPAMTRHRARSCGFIFQAYNLIPVLTAEENVTLPLLTRGDREKDARKAARDMLAVLGLTGKEQRLPQDLSGGEQQRVAIARALAPRPAVIFADEPTGNLDAARSRDVMELLTQANREKGQTIVIVTHDRKVADQCTRTVRIHDGLVVDA